MQFKSYDYKICITTSDDYFEDKKTYINGPQIVGALQTVKSGNITESSDILYEATEYLFTTRYGGGISRGDLIDGKKVMDVDVVGFTSYVKLLEVQDAG